MIGSKKFSSDPIRVARIDNGHGKAVRVSYRLFPFRHIATKRIPMRIPRNRAAALLKIVSGLQNSTYGFGCRCLQRATGSIGKLQEL